MPSQSSRMMLFSNINDSPLSSLPERCRERVRQIRREPAGSHPIQSGVRVQYPLDVCVSTSCTASFDIRNTQDRDSQEPPSRLTSWACSRWNDPPPAHVASGSPDKGKWLAAEGKEGRA